MHRRSFLEALCTVATAGTIAGCLDDGGDGSTGDSGNDTDRDDESNTSPDNGDDPVDETDAEEDAGNDTDGTDDPEDGTDNDTDTDERDTLNDTDGNDTDGNGSDSNESDEDDGEGEVDENETGGSDGNDTNDGTETKNDTDGGDGNDTDGDENGDGDDNENGEDDAGESETPEITIETTETDCASGGNEEDGNATVEGGVDEATIEMTDEGAAIRGTIGSPTPCYEARVVEREVADGDLRLLIGVESDGSDLCMECVGAVEYETTVVGAVERIVVEHERIEADPIEVDEAELN